MPRTRTKPQVGQGRRLTENDVRELRTTYRPGDRITALAERYRASRVSIVEVLNRRTWTHLEPRPGEYDPPEEMQGTRRVEKKGQRTVVTVPAAPRPAKTAPPAPVGTPEPPRTAKKNALKKRPKQLDENTVRAVRRAYRPGARLRHLEEVFGLTGGTITAIANRSTYSEYPTADNEYEPPPDIRGTRRREPGPVATTQEREPLPIHRTDTKHLTPEAIRAIREAIDDGEPIRRIARCFGVTPGAIEHMKRTRTP